MSTIETPDLAAWALRDVEKQLEQVASVAVAARNMLERADEPDLTTIRILEVITDLASEAYSLNALRGFLDRAQAPPAAS